MNFFEWIRRLWAREPVSTVPEGFERALVYFEANRSLFKNQRYITVCDYSQRSDKKRLAIWDRETGKVTRHKFGHGSGLNPGPNTGFPVGFSNTMGTHLSCLGAFATAETYNGRNGYSLRIDGLEPTNSNARKRAIVVHGCDYVNDSNSAISGRSWGCITLDFAHYKETIDKIKGGSLIYSHNGDKTPIVVPPMPGPIKARWDSKHADAAKWTAHVAALVEKSGLLQTSPKDLKDFGGRNSTAFWVYLLSCMAELESGFRPTLEYKEKFKNGKGELVISTGLLQLSYESAGGYGFKTTTAKLKDPYHNLEVGVAILSKWVKADGVIAAGTNKATARGGARFWSVLRPTKLATIKGWCVS
jgi:hypothetical protein